MDRLRESFNALTVLRSTIIMAAEHPTHVAAYPHRTMPRGGPSPTCRFTPCAFCSTCAPEDAYEYLVGANAHWMPSIAAFGDTASVDAVLDGLQVQGGMRVLVCRLLGR